MTEQTFKARFRGAHADLLGALCAAASVGLRNEKSLKLDSLPRLASFFHWASACEPALWRRGDFRRAFAANAKDATEDVIEGEQAASVFRRFMAEHEKWEGTATQLLADLVAFVRRPVREAEAAHARAVKDKDDIAKEKTAAALREARETARDILGDHWPKAPTRLPASSSGPRQRSATPASGSIGRPRTAKRKSSRSRRPHPSVGGKNRPHRPRHPTKLAVSMTWLKIGGRFSRLAGSPSP